MKGFTENIDNVHLKIPEESHGGERKISQTFDGATVFLTGVTGFLGKLFMEKLLRTSPNLRMIYILVRPKRGKDEERRFKEIFEGPVRFFLFPILVVFDFQGDFYGRKSCLLQYILIESLMNSFNNELFAIKLINDEDFKVRTQKTCVTFTIFDRIHRKIFHFQINLLHYFSQN